MFTDDPSPRGGAPAEHAAPSLPMAPPAPAAGPRERAGRHLGITQHWRALGVPGQVALLVSAAMLVCFSLPWYALPDLYAPPSPGHPFPTLTATGWSTALGRPPTWWAIPLFLFPELWLIPLGALSLLVTVFLILRGRCPPRRALDVLLASAAAALFAELGFFLEVQSLQAGFVSTASESLGELQREQISIAHTFAVLWGFWLAVGVSALALLISYYGLRRKRGPEAMTEEIAGDSGFQ
jgi:hypothetical protein